MKKIVASIAALPFAVGTVFAGTGAAEAAGFTGRIGFAGVQTNVTLSEGQISFEPNPGNVILNINTDDFAIFNGAAIEGPINFNGSGDSPFITTSVTNPFLDLGTFGFPSLDPTTQDGINTFNLKAGNEINVKDTAAGVTIDVDLVGHFVANPGDKATKGIGNLTFQIAGKDAAYIEGIFDGSIDPDVATFSGDLEVTIKAAPEPTALFGLGVVATGLVASRRKKNS